MTGVEKRNAGTRIRQYVNVKSITGSRETTFARQVVAERGSRFPAPSESNYVKSEEEERLPKGMLPNIS